MRELISFGRELKRLVNLSKLDIMMNKFYNIKLIIMKKSLALGFLSCIGLVSAIAPLQNFDSKFLES